MSSSLPESHGDPSGGRGPVSASTQSSELSTPSSLYMEYGEYSQPQWGHSILVRFPPWAAVSSNDGTCLWDAVWVLAGLGGMEIADPSLIPVSLAFLDSGQYLSSGEGMFRRPSEGQSLISYLSEQDFGSCADLEKVREAAAACVH